MALDFLGFKDPSKTWCDRWGMSPSGGVGNEQFGDSRRKPKGGWVIGSFHVLLPAENQQEYSASELVQLLNLRYTNIMPHVH